MNRYIKDGILTDALSGKRVIVIDPNRTERRAAFQCIADEPLVSIEHVRRTNGAERIDFAGGGSVRFISPGSGRGHSADVVFVRGWNELSEMQRCDILPMLNASNGELIRA